jgi:hypothetical protein
VAYSSQWKCSMAWVKGERAIKGPGRFGVSCTGSPVSSGISSNRLPMHQVGRHRRQSRAMFLVGGKCGTNLHPYRCRISKNQKKQLCELAFSANTPATWRNREPVGIYTASGSSIRKELESARIRGKSMDKGTPRFSREPQYSAA